MALRPQGLSRCFRSDAPMVAGLPWRAWLQFKGMELSGFAPCVGADGPACSDEPRYGVHVRRSRRSRALLSCAAETARLKGESTYWRRSRQPLKIALQEAANG